MIAGWVAAVLGPLGVAGVARTALVTGAAIAVGGAAAILFLIGVFDRRLQNAVSALNLERRAQARDLGWRARLFGWGLPGRDGGLVVVRVVLLVEVFASCFFPDAAASALVFAAFSLTTMVAMGLLARSYPTNAFRGGFI